jgi:hypothetical protein
MLGALYLTDELLQQGINISSLPAQVIAKP